MADLFGAKPVASPEAQAALRYRAQAPLVDAVLSELGLTDGHDLSALIKSITPAVEPGATATPDA